MRDVTIIIPQARGAVPELWESLGAADIKVEAALSFAREHHRVVHVVVDDGLADRTQDVLAEAGFLVVDVRDVLLVPLDGGASALAEITRKAEDAGAEVYLLSIATGDRVMLGAVNLDAARRALGM